MEALWNFELSKPLNIHRLMSYCENLENSAESSTEDRVLTCEAPEGDTDCTRAACVILCVKNPWCLSPRAEESPALK